LKIAGFFPIPLQEISMSRVTIYHNPRCTKSRQTLALLKEQGVEPEVVEYLKTPPDAETLRGLLSKLGLSPRALIREREYRALGLPETDDADELIGRMVAHPQIIERPIVVAGTAARLGRPPERVLEIL
jgi:arsenate reductase